MAAGDNQNDVGILTTLVGLDVTEASDQQLLFSSSWPLLKEEYQGAWAYGSATSPLTDDLVLYEHNLGYPPFFINASDYRTDGGTYPIGVQFAPQVLMRVNNTSIVFTGTGSPNSALGKIWVYRLNLKENYTSPIKNTTFRSPSRTDQNFGMKILKGDSDQTLDSTDLREYALHSGSRSPLVHMVDYGPVGVISGVAGYARRVYHGLPYNPLYFVFAERPTDVPPQYKANELIPFVELGGGATYTTGNVDYIQFQATTSDWNVSIVILKDPFEVSDGLVETVTI